MRLCKLSVTLCVICLCVICFFFSASCGDTSEDERAPQKQTTHKSADSSPKARSGRKVIAKEPRVFDRTSLGGVSFTLAAEAGECVLIYTKEKTSKRRALDMPPPCFFSRLENKELATMEVGDTVRSLIESSREDPNRPGYCDTKLRVFGVPKVQKRTKRLLLSPMNMDIAACRTPGRHDYKVYTLDLEELP